MFRNPTRLFVCLALAASLAANSPHPAEAVALDLIGPPAPPPQQSLSSLLAGFRAYDMNGDGVQEISAIAPAPFETNPHLVPAPGTPLVLVVIDDRLRASIAGSYTVADLDARLADLRRHMQRDGLVPYFLTTRLYDGPVHQDGVTLLALRRVLCRVKEVAPAFQGAVLIGSFPEATLVRRWAARAERRVTIGGTTFNAGGTTTPWLRIVPELIASRSDIVLSDLDGNWESLYRRTTQVPSIRAVPQAGSPADWPRAGQTLSCSPAEISSVTYDDCFLIDDAAGRVAILEHTVTRLRIQVDPTPIRPEVSLVDRDAINPIARPDILVSRINPLHVGVRQDAAFLDANGLPRRAPWSRDPNTAYVRDPAVARQLLIEYLDRNIAHRVGARRPNAMRTARLKAGAGLSYGPTCLGAHTLFDNATALDLVRCLKAPALVKSFVLHSNWNVSATEPGYDALQFDAETGGNYWYWERLGAEAVPTHDHGLVRDSMRFALLRTLWTNRALRNAGPAFYVHCGCNVNDVTPASKRDDGTIPQRNVAYSDAAYAGHEQLAEAMLFYANGLAILCRAKDFNDYPAGFSNAMAPATARFGHALREYSRIDSGAQTSSNDVAGYNRTYFWSVLGDWTLRLDHALPAAQSAVTLYSDASFGGQQLNLPVGRYDVTLLDSSIGNEALSSLTVASGFRVRLFHHPRFQSEGLAVTGSAASLGAMNDRTSSLFIEPINQGGVRLFQHQNYQGQSVALDAGWYDVNTLVNTIGNDQITSLTVQPGYLVFLFYHAGFVGTPLSLSASSSHLGAWNDIVSSLIVLRVQ